MDELQIHFNQNKGKKQLCICIQSKRNIMIGYILRRKRLLYINN